MMNTSLTSSNRGFFSGVWKGIKDAFGNIAGWFRDKFSAAWEAIKSAFSRGGKIFDGIKDGILNGLKTVINGIEAPLDTIKQANRESLLEVLSELGLTGPARGGSSQPKEIELKVDRRELGRVLKKRGNMGLFENTEM